MRFAGRAVPPVASVGSMTVLYPFELYRPVAYLVSRAPHWNFGTSGPESSCWTSKRGFDKLPEEPLIAVSVAAK